MIRGKGELHLGVEEGNAQPVDSCKGSVVRVEVEWILGI
jgi:hypothetical protein